MKQKSLFIFAILAFVVVLIGCAPSEEKTLADLDALSDTEFDQAMGASGKSALAGQAGRVRIPLECNVVGDNLILSRRDWG